MNDVINKIIKDLAVNYNKYKIYNEGDVISVIKNNILTESNYPELLRDNYIFDEFPIQLKYPRYISHKVYDNLTTDQKSCFDEHNEYGSHALIGKEDSRKEVLKTIGKNYDIGKVNVDLAIINKNKYNVHISSNSLDYKFEEHEYVIHFKYLRDPNRKLSINKTDNYIRKGIGNCNIAKIYLQRDIEGINSIVEDGLAKQGYFIFVSEGGQLKEEYVENAKNKDEYKGQGFIYLYENNKDCDSQKIIFNLIP